MGQHQTAIPNLCQHTSEFGSIVSKAHSVSHSVEKMESKTLRHNASH